MMARAATGPTTTPAIQAFPEERLTGSEEVLDVEGLVDAMVVDDRDISIERTTFG